MNSVIALTCLVTIACVVRCQDSTGQSNEEPPPEWSPDVPEEAPPEGPVGEPNDAPHPQPMTCQTYLDCVQAGLCTDHQHGVCDPVDKYCHCHDYGEIECDNDQICNEKCPEPGQHCCHNDHHCHCGEPCGENYATPLPPPPAGSTGS